MRGKQLNNSNKVVLRRLMVEVDVAVEWTIGKKVTGGSGGSGSERLYVIQRTGMTYV